MKLAVVSPFPPQRTGIADYTARLIPYLRPHFEQLYAVVEGIEPELERGAVDGVLGLPEYLALWRKSKLVPLYHVGCNTHFHGWIVRALRLVPGFVTLHDGNLLPMVHDLTVGARSAADFVREAAFERGEVGLDSGWRALWDGEPLEPAAFSMVARIARSSLGLIVHSRCLADRVKRVAPRARIAVIPHIDLMDADGEPSCEDEACVLSDVRPGECVIGLIGVVAPDKQVESLLEAFAALAGEFPTAAVVCVGDIVPGYSIQQIAHSLGLAGRVRFTGYVPGNQLDHFARRLDIGVSLRHPTWGETSGALIRMMGSGVPTIVSDAGAYAEFPEDAVVKVPPGRAGRAKIERALRDLLSSSEHRRRVGAAARAYVRSTCEPGSIGSMYARFIKDTVALGAQMVHFGEHMNAEDP